MSVLTTSSRIGSSIASALGIDADSVAIRKPERLYSMKLLPNKTMLKGNRVHADGEIVDVNETTARQFYSDGTAIALEPDKFDPPLTIAKRIEPNNSPGLLDGESTVEVKVRRDKGFFFAGRTHAKNDLIKVPETCAAHGIHFGAVELAKGAGLSPRGKAYLAALRSGLTNPVF
jgi:hypothetical protein